MALYYQTDYRLGRRGRVSRTYTGPRAVAAIAFDLFLSLVFGIIAFALWLVWTILVAVLRFARDLVLVPLEAFRRSFGAAAHRPGKPAVAGFEEL